MPIPEAQGLLADNEVLLLFFDTLEDRTTPDETFLWAVTKSETRWVRIAAGKKALTEQVERLRCGLDASSWDDPNTWPEGPFKREQTRRLARCRQLTGTETITLEQLPPFHRANAYELYSLLLGQIEDLIKDKRLLVVPSGPLAGLPFQVLVTGRSAANPLADAADLRDAPWLIKRSAITVLPTVRSLSDLRKQRKSTRAAASYIGFGNPLLEGPSGADKTAWEKQKCSAGPSTVGAKANRNLARARANDLRGGGDVAKLRSLEPLPETADELCAVANVLGAQEADIYLGRMATETNVKKLNSEGALKDRRIVHFATHGLLAGETKNLSDQTVATGQYAITMSLFGEPALVLTPPPAPTETDDGLLTASEIMQLQLDADWIVLSACNTAGRDWLGARTLSGLAHSFFYAGARALLASHWVVDSEAAVRLITKTFEEINANPNLGRAEALRRSMLALIGSGGRNEHPATWAPFVVVGEGAH